MSCPQKKKQIDEKAKVVAAVWGTEFIQFYAALQILHQDDLKKRMIRRMDAWRNGCFRKIDGSHHTKQQPSQNGYSSKKISSNHPCCLLASAALNRQQRRPLPALLSVSSSMVSSYRIKTMAPLPPPQPPQPQP